MDAVKDVVVNVANAFAPGAGVAVAAAFELGATLVEIGGILAGVRETASAIEAHRENIEKKVKKLEGVVELLKRVEHQDALTNALQREILESKEAVEKYDRDVTKFTNFNIVKQHVFHNEIDESGAEARELGKELLIRLTAECAVDGSRHHGQPDQAAATPPPNKVHAAETQNSSCL